MGPFTDGIVGIMRASGGAVYRRDSMPVRVQRLALMILTVLKTMEILVFRPSKNTPLLGSVRQFVSTSDVRHDVTFEVGMGQPTLKQWKRHHVESLDKAPR